MTTKTDAQRDAEIREEDALSQETATEPEAVETTAPEAGATEDDDAAAEAAAEAELAQLAKDNAEADRPSGVGQGAAAIVSVALGVVAMSGSWLGTVASARESLIGQLNTSQSASVATQVSEVYGDSWHAAALVGGVFSLIALIVGAFVLVRPAFGVPGRPQAIWIKSVAWAGVSLGVLGLLLAVAKYSDLLLGLPKTS
ncbi:MULTISPECIES: hypothetical protein [unclassified Streptomyces]|uniref:hypothetical protein n=1 Tax=unclassified Streptomyces TaxID=2593676 RepID=UPI000DB95E0D|nr:MULTISPECIES: hypothetical protein [unclassified Streptomyces]MYT69580.1 hypothetical protein [Streptomyces sp. SID8367]RAJ74130.1 hypothetical protein K377_06792 [Streptomyces sp. PsTaAH-137]